MADVTVWKRPGKGLPKLEALTNEETQKLSTLVAKASLTDEETQAFVELVAKLIEAKQPPVGKTVPIVKQAPPDTLPALVQEAVSKRAMTPDVKERIRKLLTESPVEKRAAYRLAADEAIQAHTEALRLREPTLTHREALVRVWSEHRDLVSKSLEPGSYDLKSDEVDNAVADLMKLYSKDARAGFDAVRKEHSELFELWQIVQTHGSL